ncbi:MAG TPA: hypothetical protein VE422_01380 [Terriglobia bacterium]|nr:hypothetical protein [Terriglobia bacterium]
MMRNRVFASLEMAILALVPIAILGQAPKPAPKAASKATPKIWTGPKTPWGDPDLQGTWTSDDYIGVPMQRPTQVGTREAPTDEEIAQRQAQLQKQAETDSQEFVAENAKAAVNPPGHWGERARRPPRQTSLIVDPPDGRMPALTPEAQQRQAELQKVRQGNPGGPEDRSLYDRCITRGVTGSIFPVIYGNGTEIVQSPGFVTILTEMIHEARIVPLDGRPHAGKDIRTYMGDPRGHWEGATLVVETTNFTNKTGIGLNGGGVTHTEALKLVERFTRLDASTIKYEVTIDDPQTYTRPWTVSFPITQEPGYRNFEYACHEGNYALHNILSAARADEANKK